MPGIVGQYKMDSIAFTYLFYFLFDCCFAWVWMLEQGGSEGERQKHKFGQVGRIWEVGEGKECDSNTLSGKKASVLFGIIINSLVQ